MTQESVIHTSSSVTTTEKWLTCNGNQLRKLTQAALTELDNNHKLVNDLNVFPVPDGDTGTNMLLTMRSAYKRIQDSQETHVGKVANELSQGALMGARGNSGVILSQIWRGLASSLKDSEAFDANELANALKPVVLPGEFMRVFILKEGKEYNQGVAYLDDGTMVVVDNARKRMGKNVDVTVTSVLQTTAGKMIFGKAID